MEGDEVMYSQPSEKLVKATTLTYAQKWKKKKSLGVGRGTIATPKYLKFSFGTISSSREQD